MGNNTPYLQEENFQKYHREGPNYNKKMKRGGKLLNRLSKEQWLREIQWRIDVLGLSFLKGTSFSFPVASQKIVSGVYLNPLAFSRKGKGCIS